MARDDLILSDARLAALRERAIALAVAGGYEELASALRDSCVNEALDVVRALSHDGQALVLWLLFEGKPGAEAMAHRIAAINHHGAISPRFPVPHFSPGPARPAYYERLLAYRSEIVRLALSLHRGRELAIVRYLAMAAIAARVQRLGIAMDMNDEARRETLAAFTATLGEYASAAVVEDGFVGAEELGEAFGLALAGYTVAQRPGGTWIAYEAAAQ